MANPRRSHDENTQTNLALVPSNRRRQAADGLVVLGTRRICQPPRLLENHEEISCRRNSPWSNRSLVSCTYGVQCRPAAGRSWVGVASVFVVRLVPHVWSSRSALHPSSCGVGRRKTESDGRGLAYWNVPPRLSALGCVAGCHDSNRRLLEPGRRVARGS